MIMNCANVIAACCFWYAWLALWWWLRLGDNNHGYYCDVEDPCCFDGDGGCCWDVAVDCDSLMWRCWWRFWWRAWRLRCLFGNMICILCLPIFCIWNDDNCNKCGVVWWTTSWKITAIMAMIEMALWRYCLRSACSDGAAFCRLVVGFEDGFFNLMRGMVAAVARMFLSVLGMRCLCCAILLGMLELTSRRSWIWLLHEYVFDTWLMIWCGCEWGGYEHGLVLRVWRIGDCLSSFSTVVWWPAVDGDADLHVWKVFWDIVHWMHGWWNWIFCIEVCFRDVTGWDARRIRAFGLRSWNVSIVEHVLMI